MEDPEITGVSQVTDATKKPIVRRKVVSQSIPEDILNNAALNEAIKRLPSNYSFEVHKTLWRIRTCDAKKVALQFPEGLLMYACSISDILERFAGVETLIMGDVTYGACCIDDFTAKALGCDFMVHYGHSCLVPIDVSQMNTLYVFVDIGFNITHLISMLQSNFSPDARLILAGTIQFSSAIQAAKRVLATHFPNVLIPQCRPLSQGEVLGCTSPYLPEMYPAQPVPVASSCCSQKPADSCCKTASTEKQDGCCASSPEAGAGKCSDSKEEAIVMELGAKTTQKDICVFVADGRFHLEALMIHNPQIDEFYKYDPYNKMLTREAYDTETLHTTRWDAIERARGAKKWGVVLGTLGRQGSAALLARIEKELKARGKDFFVVLLSEVFPAKLALMADVGAWVQIACPRLSIDWGYAFSAPLLSTYEFDVALGLAEWLPRGIYPMDYYSNQGGAWTNYHERQQQKMREVTPDGGMVRPKHSAIAKLKARAAARRAARESAEAEAVVEEPSGFDVIETDTQDVD
jgi:2-(3-amino-3-carboxypropyl)histidine synthase